jgi:hypothetical protein
MVERERSHTESPGQFATGQAALGQYRRLVYFGLPLDHYNSFVAR